MLVSNDIPIVLNAVFVSIEFSIKFHIIIKF